MEWFALFSSGFSLAAEFATSPIGITLACLIIVLWALYAYRRGFKRRIQPLVQQLEDACRHLQSTEDGESFAAGFHDFDQAIRDNPLLGDAWREFHETLLFPDSDDEQVIRNVQSPSLYFRRDALLGRQLNLRLYNAIPNLLTGAGILGTFIGLVAGIYLASGNLASPDIEQARTAMQQLLHGASLAFITSIVGLLSSIIFSLREKHWVHRFDERLGCWVAHLDRRLRRMTPEQLAREQLQQTRQQTDVVQGFTDQLAFQIADAFDQKLQEHVATSVAPALDTLVKEIQGLRQDRQSSDEDMLKGLLEQFTGQLSGAAGSEMQALATTLGALNDKLHAQTEAAEKHHQANQEAARESNDTLAKLFKEGTEDFQRRVGESVDAITERLGGLLDSS